MSTLLCLPATLLAETFYEVSGVRSNDSLNIRAKANYRTKKLGEIPHDGTCIKRIRCGASWCQIDYQGISGWVHSRYLKEMAADNSCQPEVEPPAESVSTAPVTESVNETETKAADQPEEAEIVEQPSPVPETQPAPVENPAEQSMSNNAEPVEPVKDDITESGNNRNETVQETPGHETAESDPSEPSHTDDASALSRSQMMIQITRTLCSKQLLTSSDPVAEFRHSAQEMFSDYTATEADQDSQTGDPLIHIKAKSEYGRVFADYYGEVDGLTRCAVTLIPYQKNSSIRADDIDRRIELAMRMSGRSLVATHTNEEKVGTISSPVKTIAKYYGANCNEINIKTSQSSIRDVTRISTITLALTGNLQAPATGCNR